MKPHQQRFLELALAREALRFGEFTLKSGRSSPYFFNAGRFDSGAALATLGECYADALADSAIAFDGLFGPAYKGIPLATALALALAARGRDVPLSFNRKEAKTHGEGGSLIGAPLRGRIVIVDDVITAGTAIRESVAIIQDAGAEVAGIVLALDRQERGQDDRRSAAQEVADTFAIPVCAIASLDALLQFAGEQPHLALQRTRLLQYREHYGCSE
ncbi:MAG: orotate phosphoribosyltransferase [Gammaproteobacteria bacterium HGW-Gammaproteobacteria-4]|nr:MAG: orotate phosphoribosyltransferase [Gammaproteobacteria bacterium HGW-Gammaproteobacteria-4]